MRALRTLVLAAVVLSGLTALPAAHAAATVRYVDCSAAGSGDGTAASPYTSLAPVNALTLAPGDQVLFRRGTTCTGELAPKGGGSTGSPVVVGAYGAGTARPVIDAAGAANAVLLRNISQITVQDLELTAPGDNTQRRRGVYVYASDAGTVSGITLQRLSVHDVRGLMPSTVSPYYHGNGKYADATGAIVVEAAGTAVPTAFAGMRILDNEIRSVDRQGIYTWSNWCRRPELATFWNSLCTANWQPSTGLVIRGNRLDDVGGDGIVVKGSTGALVERNRLTGFNVRSGSPNAGMWTANSDDTVFQFNDTSGGRTTSDGMAYDVDHSTRGTVFQYNLSHDNEGGFFLLCPYDRPTADFTIRYNISVNDRARGFQVCPGPLTNGQIYNNTIEVGAGISTALVTESTSATLDVSFRNNVVRKEGAGTVSWALTDPAFTVDHNAFRNVAAYAGATGTVTAAPGLAAPQVRDPRGIQLLAGYPLLAAGAPIADNGGRDYFGNPVPAGTAPNIGAYQGPGVGTPVSISRFDTDAPSAAPAGWTTSPAGTAVVADPAGDFGRALALTQGAADTSAVTSFTASGDLRISARVWAGQPVGTPFGLHLLDAAGAPVAQFSLAASGRTAWTQAGVWQETGPAYTARQWHLLELVLHPAAGAYDVRWDGAEVVTGAATGPSAGPAAQVRARVPGAAAPTGGFTVDEVIVGPAS
ncbi:right-handed parallel beta-helix repeat-containing protein [Kitasatospora sp. NPDC058170]|uniref:right-handed parallel beta-helix repeat-containing protein n=1 Tax=Kitasatospora sp. NPDC058170 TaxID=3346364 RepID=UPI0036DDCA05